MHRIDHVLYSKLDHLPSIAQQLLAYAGSHRIWLLEGDMGVGKTTLIKAVCQQLGVQDHVTSPTFSLVNEYAMPSGELVYHFDFYRIRHEEEIMWLDCAHYFEGGSYCFVEWPTKALPMMPASYYNIAIKRQAQHERTLHLTAVTASSPLSTQ